MNNNIFFSADTHIGHKNVLKYVPNRPYALEQDTKAHDEWLIGLWQNMIGKHDRIYFAGDLTFYNSEVAKRLLEKLPGEKYISTGNHDESIKAHLNYFRKASQINSLRESAPDFSTAASHWSNNSSLM